MNRQQIVSSSITVLFIITVIGIVLIGKSVAEEAGIGSFFKKPGNDEPSTPPENELQALIHDEVLVAATKLSKDLATATQQLRDVQMIKPLQETTSNRQAEPTV
ncbi:hypothetical protein LTR84_007908 [Exophiala bonariae]|uniref:Uncharacterized protein n=1 Tax=Exophiala bonariae TaxID=1690606 RepID=A0AAV9NN20_9EURO|nr:hypothetical protein LTR84_007908 [Exophiala bonariae]